MIGLPRVLYRTLPEVSFIKTSFLQGQITPSEPAIKPIIVASVGCLNFFKTKLKTFESNNSPPIDPPKNFLDELFHMIVAMQRQGLVNNVILK